MSKTLGERISKAPVSACVCESSREAWGCKTRKQWTSQDGIGRDQKGRSHNTWWPCMVIWYLWTSISFINIKKEDKWGLFPKTELWFLFLKSSSFCVRTMCFWYLGAWGLLTLERVIHFLEIAHTCWPTSLEPHPNHLLISERMPTYSSMWLWQALHPIPSVLLKKIRLYS